MKTYKQLFDVAVVARRDLESCGRRMFRDGVEREAALAAVRAGALLPPGHVRNDLDRFCSDLASVFVPVFERFEVKSPRWDGSIA